MTRLNSLLEMSFRPNIETGSLTI